MVFKTKTWLGNTFQFNDCVSKEPNVGLFISFREDSSRSTIMLNVHDTWM